MDTRRVSLAFTTTAIKDARHLKRLGLPVRGQHANAILLIFNSRGLKTTISKTSMAGIIYAGQAGEKDGLMVLFW
jgi:hypothetical protein